MALNHGTVRDTDPHFTIDPVTRKLSTESAKITIVQGDHNSERFTFEVPQTIEGHDMSKAGRVEIHYLNIDSMTKEQSSGRYDADDVALVPAEGTNPAKVTFSWLISGGATKYAGVLNFALRFVCDDGDSITYSWGTAIYTGIMVASGYTGEMVAEEYDDILKKWELELKANQVVSLEQTKVGEDDGGENVWTASFGDGRTSDLKVKNGLRGPTGLVGSIETVNNKRLNFFVGTKAEYDALSEEVRAGGLFAIITDDTTEADIYRAREEVLKAREAVGSAIDEAIAALKRKMYLHIVQLKMELSEQCHLVLTIELTLPSAERLPLENFGFVCLPGEHYPRAVLHTPTSEEAVVRLTIEEGSGCYIVDVRTASGNISRNLEGVGFNEDATNYYTVVGLDIPQATTTKEG